MSNDNEHGHDGCPFGGRDVVIAGPTTQSGQACVRHKSDHTVELGEMRPVAEGRPLFGELVRISGDGPAYDVESVYDTASGESEASGKGPAKVTTEAYRRGWDAIFGKRPAGQA